MMNYPPSIVLPGTCNGRLTLASGTAITTTDQTSKTSVYFTPHLGNRVSLYDGSGWISYPFTELTLSLGTLVAYQAYDVFLYDNAGTLTLEATEWANATITMTIATPCVVTWTGHGMSTGQSIVFTTTSALPTGVSANTRYFVTVTGTDTFNLSTSLANVAAGTLVNSSGSQSGTHTGHQPQARQTAIAFQDGIYCKSGSLTRRYLGTFLTTSTTTTEDSISNRFLWNHYNQAQRKLKVVETTASWNYSLLTWRQARATASNLFSFVLGLENGMTEAVVAVTATNGGGFEFAVGIGLDSTNMPSSDMHPSASQANSTATNTNVAAWYRGYPSIGYHSLVWLEIARASGTTTWYGQGTAIGSKAQSGMVGWIWG